jgi:hypothetical protein
MAFTNEDFQKVQRINRCITAFFETSNATKVEAKELMGTFIEKGIFQSNDKDGLPIRKFLKHLEDQGIIRLVPQAIYEQKNKSKSWFFIKGIKNKA